MTIQLIRPYSVRRAKAHLSTAAGQPLCGGGRGGKSVQWQQDIGPANCARCQQIASRATTALRKNTQLFTPPQRAAAL